MIFYPSDVIYNCSPGCLSVTFLQLRGKSSIKQKMQAITIQFFLSHIFKASALWADAFYKSKCPSVCLCECLSVCSLLSYHLTVFLPHFPKSDVKYF